MLIMGVDTAETWQAHFSGRGWATPQDQINAGHSAFIAPGLRPAVYEEVIDYGTVIASCRIGVTFTRETVAGSPSITVQISTRAAASDAWQDMAEGDTAYGSGFRFVRVRVTMDGGICAIDKLRIKLDKKLRNDGGKLTAQAADAGGTWVAFAVPFIDVQSITLTAGGTVPLTAIYDFKDAPNPTGFKVLVFNSAGQRVTAPVSWSAKGV